MLSHRGVRERDRPEAVDVSEVHVSAPIEIASAHRGDRSDHPAVRILLVCTGNVIRSALVERALRRQFAFIGADRIELSSAGTHAAVGQGMWTEAIEIARAYGFEHRDFVARQLDERLLDQTDYVITAAREHRDAVLRLRPELAPRTFTFREFVRILDSGVPHPPSAVGDTGGLSAADRWIAITAWADRERNVHPAGDPLDDDLDDPRDGHREALWSFERDLVHGVVSIAAAVTGEPR